MHPTLSVLSALAQTLRSFISPLFPSSILDTSWPGGLIFWYHIFLPFHTVHGVLMARILEWFAIPFSSEKNGQVPLNSGSCINFALCYCRRLLMRRRWQGCLVLWKIRKWKCLQGFIILSPIFLSLINHSFFLYFSLKEMWSRKLFFPFILYISKLWAHYVEGPFLNQWSIINQSLGAASLLGYWLARKDLTKLCPSSWGMG